MTAFESGQPTHLADHHGENLAEDLVRLRALMGRRSALGWMGSAATFALLGACGGSDSGMGAPVTVAPTPSPSPTPTATPTATPTPTPTATGGPNPVCALSPTETRGPYPADGTNASSGSTNNVLTASGIVRSNIRPSFIGSSTVAAGVPLTLTITLVNLQASCAPLANYAIYLWHADALGRYSLYSAPSETYLRGVQQTNASGKVTFQTIVPGCYAGRFPHLHVEIFATLASANNGANALLVGQLIVPASVCSAVYADTATYAGSATNFAAVTIANDNVFGDNSTTENLGRTLEVTGSVAAGYTAQVTVGINTGATA